MSRLKPYEYRKKTQVLILIILEVLYENFFKVTLRSMWKVLILIILEVLYEKEKFPRLFSNRYSLNPYYTGSTL